MSERRREVGLAGAWPACQALLPSPVSPGLLPRACTGLCGWMAYEHVRLCVGLLSVAHLVCCQLSVTRWVLKPIELLMLVCVYLYIYLYPKKMNNCILLFFVWVKNPSYQD